MIEKIKNMRITFDYGKLALFFSLMAMAFVGMSQNTPCAYAQAGACSVGENIIATGNIGIMGGTSDTATFDASGITAARTLTIPDASGTLALSSGALPINKVMATDGAGAETTTDVYPLSLTVSTPLKTDGAGLVTSSDLDITTDLTPGGALEQIRVNAGGTALEYFTASSGSDIRKVADGNMVVNSGDPMMVIACWHGQITLDPDKEYSLYIDGSPYNIAQVGSYTNWFRPQTGDCTSGGGSGFVTSGIKTAWDVVGNSANTQSFSTAENYCFGIAGGAYNTSGTRVSNIAGVLNLRAWRNEGYGFNMDWKLSATAYDSLNSPTQVQFGTGTCLDVTTADFDTITGIDFFLEGNGNTSRKWALYEIDY